MPSIFGDQNISVVKSGSINAVNILNPFYRYKNTARATDADRQLLKTTA